MSEAAEPPIDPAARRRRLLEALAGEDLTPEVTQDELPQEPPIPDRDEEFEANRPPHHG